MLHPCYHAGWDDEQYSAFGLTLQPLTLGHARCLYILNSPFVVPGDGTISKDDLLLAASICSVQRAPINACGMDDVIDAAGSIAIDVNIIIEADKFSAYFKKYCSVIPRFDSTPPQQRVPWPWAYNGILRRYYGYTKQDAWEELCAEAFWLGVCVAVQNGDTGYATLEEQPIIMMMGKSDG